MNQEVKLKVFKTSSSGVLWHFASESYFPLLPTKKKKPKKPIKTSQPHKKKANKPKKLPWKHTQTTSKNDSQQQAVSQQKHSGEWCQGLPIFI